MAKQTFAEDSDLSDMKNQCRLLKLASKLVDRFDECKRFCNEAESLKVLLLQDNEYESSDYTDDEDELNDEDYNAEETKKALESNKSSKKRRGRKGKD